jgi:hypothetical protein
VTGAREPVVVTCFFEVRSVRASVGARFPLTFEARPGTENVIGRAWESLPVKRIRVVLQSNLQGHPFSPFRRPFHPPNVALHFLLITLSCFYSVLLLRTQDAEVLFCDNRVTAQPRRVSLANVIAIAAARGRVAVPQKVGLARRRRR